MLNNIILEGWVLNNPEVVAKGTITGSNLVKFMMHNVCREDGTTVDMTLPIQSWGEVAEKVLDNITEGMLVRIVGRLMKCTVETPQGHKKTSVEIVCSHIEYRSNDDKTRCLEDESK